MKNQEEIVIQKKNKKKKIKEKIGVILANTIAFTFMLSRNVFADVSSGDVTSAIEKVVVKLASLIFIAAVLMAIYGVNAYSKANREQDPHAKSKAMGFIEGAVGLGVAGTLMITVLKPLIVKAFS